MKVEREALRQGIDFATSHPGYEVQLVFEKAYNMYRSDDDALPWIGGGWIDASKAPWLAGKLGAFAGQGRDAGRDDTAGRRAQLEGPCQRLLLLACC